MTLWASAIPLTPGVQWDTQMTQDLVLRSYFCKENLLVIVVYLVDNDKASVVYFGKFPIQGVDEIDHFGFVSILLFLIDGTGNSVGIIDVLAVVEIIDFLIQLSANAIFIDDPYSSRISSFFVPVDKDWAIEPVQGKLDFFHMLIPAFC